MSIKKKLSRTECLKRVKSRDMTQEMFDMLVSENLVTGSGRIINSRGIKNRHGDRCLLRKPYFTMPGSKKTGGGQVCKEPHWSDKQRNMMTEIEEIWIKYSYETEQVVK